MTDWMELREDEYEERVLSARRPVLVEFWAPWCGPCRKYAPAIAGALDDLGGRILRLRVNTDESERLPEECGVVSIPTLILYDRGEEIGRFEGKMSREALAEGIRRALAEGEQGEKE